MKIYFPVFSRSVSSKRFSLFGSNPGVGGTEFITIQLVLSLAAERPDWKIVLASYGGIDIDNPSSNISQEMFESVSDFFQSFSLCLADYSDDASNFEHTGIVIATVATLKRADIHSLKKVEERLIAWSHHPFDIEAAKLASVVNFRGIVCVGIYQYYSNKMLSSFVHHIQNIFSFPQQDQPIRYRQDVSETLNIVYLGALIPGKGFLELAKAWHQLKSRFPGIKLHVIGSSATYGSEPEIDEVPASADYARAILEFISKEDIHSGDVVFHGNLGTEKFDVMQQCDLAILNPTGATEAFPASPLECMAYGLPVIASDDYGMSDAMRFFPDLVIDGHKNIVEKVEWLVADPLRYLEMQQRSVAVAHWFASQTDQIVTRWIRLLQSFETNSPSELRLLPTTPFYGSRRKLLFRRDVKPRLSVVKRTGLKALKAFD